MKKTYSLFHINTSFSSIDHKNLRNVISKCYWPLLDLVEYNNYKISIEASGKSILDINNIDPQWIKKLKNLIRDKKCEFIGSGYSQIISPSIPYKINYKNLVYGNEIYKKFLNYRPQIALINEQAFSNSLIRIYKKFFKAIIIDHLNHPYFESDNQEPQILTDDCNNKISVIWSNSISFQRFQRYIFGDIKFEDYLEYFNNYKKIFFCLYSSDVEIFDFRPKGSKSERPLSNGEWIKIRNLYEYLIQNKKVNFIFFRDVLKKINKKNIINVTSIVNPTIVKKQKKYNINRWLVAGKNNLELNTLCFNAYNSIKNQKKSKKNLIRLCELWGSDFRTFSTISKIRYFHKNIRKLINYKKIKNENSFFEMKNLLKKKLNNLVEDNNYISFKNSIYSIKINKKKGLTIDSFMDYSIGKQKLFGTIKQGTFKKSLFENDFFSTHYTILDKSTLKRYSGLHQNKVKIYSIKNQICFRSSQKIKKKCICHKEIILNTKKSELIINYKIKNLSSIYTRLNFITFDPTCFNKQNFFISSYLGDKIPEIFNLTDKKFNHGSFVENVGSLVTSNNSIPSSEGKIIIGDDEKQLHFKIDQNLSSLVPFIEYEKKSKSHLLRLYFSAKESDEISSDGYFKQLKASIKINVKNKYEKNKVRNSIN